MVSSPPHSPIQGRGNGSPDPDPRTVDDAQLAQDIDAARQMNRARVTSNNLHRQQQDQTLSSEIVGSESLPIRSGSIQSPNHPFSSSSGLAQNDHLREMHVNDYLGMPANVANQSVRQPITPGSHDRIPITSFSPSSPPIHHNQSALQQQHQQAAAAHAQAARFYMQNQRRGSNTSIDSASHFIDHRNQQPISIPTPISPTSFRHGNGRMSMSRSSGAGGPFGSSLRQDVHLNNSAVDDNFANVHVDDILTPHSIGQTRQSNVRTNSGSLGGGSAGRNTNFGRVPNRSERLVDIGDENDEIQAGLSSSQRSAMQNSEMPHTPSRRPSLAEDDVCFPMHTPGADQMARIESQHEGGIHLNHDETRNNLENVYHQPSHEFRHDDRDQVVSTENQPLPPGFPWTFDLSSLQEYADQERKRVQEEATASANSTWAGGLRNRSGAATIAGTRDIRRQMRQDQNVRSSSYGLSPDSDDATFYSRRPKKFVNLSNDDPEGKASGRYQRKLALFEGAGSSPPPIASRSSLATATDGQQTDRNILGKGALLSDDLKRHRDSANKKVTGNGFPPDNKTPLLDNSTGGGGQFYQGTNVGGKWSPSDDDEEDERNVPTVSRSLSVGADLSNLVRRTKNGQRPMRAAAHTRTNSYGSEKQYRFTFYSNALPNTIHARHLYELPAPGQTFEELLMGVEARNTANQTEASAAATTTEVETDKLVNDDVPITSTAATNNNSNINLSPGPSNGKPLSALTSALMGSGRLEGNTAPNTGSNTPDYATSIRTATQGQGTSNVASNNGGKLSVGQIGTTGIHSTAIPGATSTTAPLPAATMEKARALPGGGYRVEQDPDTCTWWLDVLCPTDQEMKTLSRVFGIHPLTTEDILMEETREKIELFRNYYLVCFRSFDQDPYSPTYLEPLNMYVIVFREGTLSFHFRATPHPQNVRRRIKQLKDYINVTSDWISYALIDDITDAFGPLIQSIEYEVDSIDELVLILKEAEQSDMLRRIGTCRKKVMGLLRLMGNKADVVKGLAKRCNENWSVAPKSDIGLYLSDIQDHLITMTQNLNHYEKILSRSHSNYLAQISIEMTDANNQINDVLSKLTALGTVIVPLNVITGLWGMNVNVPGQGVESLDWFFGILSVMIALAVVGYFATIRYLSR